MTIENTDAPNVHEMYRQLETPQGAHLERCPICEAEAQLWQFSEKPDAIVQRVVMCSHGDEIGPQDGIVNSGCLLYMPDEAFYQPTAREAIRYWNGFAVALRELRAGNAPAADPQKSSPEQRLRAENERLRIAAENAAERMEVWNFSSANDIARNLRAALAAAPVAAHACTASVVVDHRAAATATQPAQVDEQRLHSVADELFDHLRITDKCPALTRDEFREAASSLIAGYISGPDAGATGK